MKEIKYPHLDTQRIDNFLFTQFKKIPKPLIYRLLRKKNIRLNGKNVKAFTKLEQNDILRLPDFLFDEFGQNENKIKNSDKAISQINDCIIYEDEYFIVLNKSPNFAVHKGSSLDFGIIEILNQKYPNYELAHRLDKKTTGCLIIAKNRQIAKKFHELFRNRQIRKHYLALSYGFLDKSVNKIELPLYKKEKADLRKKVIVDEKLGKESITYIRKVDWVDLTDSIVFGKNKNILETKKYSLINLEIKSGRTHQIRVHLAHLNHPVVGDDRYDEKNTHLKNSTLMLHCQKLQFIHPATNERFEIQAELNHKFNKIIRFIQK